MPPELHKAEVEQLDRTIHGLIRYLDINRGTHTWIICHQTGLCCNALVLLHTPYARSNGLDSGLSQLSFTAVAAIDSAAKMAFEMATRFVEHDRYELHDYTHGDIPPFILPWLYMSGARYVELHKRDGSEEWLGRLGTLEKTLEITKGKWKAAGTSTTITTRINRLTRCRIIPEASAGPQSNGVIVAELENKKRPERRRMTQPIRQNQKLQATTPPLVQHIICRHLISPRRASSHLSHSHLSASAPSAHARRSALHPSYKPATWTS